MVHVSNDHALVSVSNESLHTTTLSQKQGFIFYLYIVVGLITIDIMNNNNDTTTLMWKDISDVPSDLQKGAVTQ